MAALAAPVVGGVVTAVLWNPWFALVALVTPVIAIGTWVGGSVRSRMSRRRSARRYLGHRVRFERRAVAHRRASVRARRVACPAAADLVEWVATSDGRLWERRRQHEDFMRVRLGALDSGDVMRLVLSPGLVVGVVGPESDRRAVARSLVGQAAAHHGPADVCLRMVTTDDDAWAWARWLPHMSGEGSDLVVLDRAAPVSDRDVAVMSADGSGVMVVAPSLADLPGGVDVVLDVAAGRVIRPGVGRSRPLAEFDRLGELEATRLARSLARFEDPEGIAGSARVPTTAPLLHLIGSIDPEDIALRWKRSEESTTIRFPLGRGLRGPVEVDLVADGPHALVAGTTGSGKSELLRTLVVSAAASADPDRLNFVLVDYKGGSAFDACDRLPHVVGVVTDLDERLAERALISLEAELRRREQRLRASGVGSIDELWSFDREGPMPRLAIVIDEFAALAKELPDFMTKLVDIAQRGRSLGVHLVLATQRPAGVVNDAIRANTNLRIALRVQSAAESQDVIRDPSAAELDRRTAGCGMLRVGADEPTMIQVAHVGGDSTATTKVRCRPFGALVERGGTDTGVLATSDLDRIVAAIREAAELRAFTPAPPPWPEPLPTKLQRCKIPAGAAGSVFGIADDPAGQRTFAVGWSPADGHLLMFGMRGAGTTTAVISLLQGLDAVPHVYVVDCDEGRLAEWSARTRSGVVVEAADPSLLRRLLNVLVDTVDGVDADVPTVLAVDGYARLGELLAEDRSGELSRQFARIIAEGPPRGVVLVATVRNPSDVPYRILAQCPARLAFGLGDRFDYRALGCETSLSDPPPGRAIDVRSGLDVQVALPDDTSRMPLVRRSRPIEALPAKVVLEPSDRRIEIENGVWRMPLGLDDRYRETAALELPPGTAALVAGPRRSGRSTTLAAIGGAAIRAGCRVLALAPPGSPLHPLSFETVDDPEELLAVEAAHRPVLVLIDDAETVDSEAAIRSVAKRDGVRVICAALAAELRGRYGHWTDVVRRSGCGVLLQPTPPDGDLLGTALPRMTLASLPGRGYIVQDGIARLFQVAVDPGGWGDS